MVLIGPKDKKYYVEEKDKKQLNLFCTGPDCATQAALDVFIGCSLFVWVFSLHMKPDRSPTPAPQVLLHQRFGGADNDSKQMNNSQERFP